MTEARVVRFPNKSKPGALNPNWKDAGRHTCKNCGVEFHSYNKRRKYCSHECFTAHRFNPETYLTVRQKKGRAIKQWTLDLRQPKEHSRCLECGEDTGNAKRKYCLEHRSLGYSLAVRRHRATLPSRTDIRQCLHCQKEFKAHRSDPQKYCTYDCFLASGGAVRAGLAAAMATMNYGAKKDANHKEIIEYLKARFIPFIDLSPLGCGVPDLLVEASGRLQLWEIKNLKTSYGKKGLNKNQKAWAEKWRGSPIKIIHTIDDAEDALEIRNERN